MKIIKSTETIPVEHPVFCIFGQPGIGKSSLGYSADEPLLLDFDKGAHRAANRRDTLQIDTWADVVELVESKDALKPYKTIVVDTVGRCLDVLAVDIMEQNPKHGRGASLTLQGYGELKGRFQTWVSRLRTLGKDVVLIAHHKEDKDGDSMIIRPDITGGSYAEVMKVADFVGYVYMRAKDRVVDFNPTDRWVGKNPAGWRPILVPEVAKATTFMAGLIEQGREALGALSDESAAIAQQVDGWRTAIDGYSTPEECTKAIDEVNKLVPIAQAQVKALLNGRTKALGFTFDRAKKVFVAPLVAAAAVVDTPTAAELGF